MAAGYGINTASKAYVDSAMRDLPKASLKDIDKLMEGSGMEAVSIPGLNNAMYVAPNRAKQIGLPENYHNSGIVAYDPSFRNLGVIAHELGHQSIEKTPGLSRFNQKKLKPFFSLLTGLSPIAGYAAGRITGKPWTGPLASVAVQALVNTPGYINESQATQIAIDKLRKMNLPPKDRVKYRKTLNRAKHTYMWPELLYSAISGGILGTLGAEQHD
jgi:hypothetical protein